MVDVMFKNINDILEIIKLLSEELRSGILKAFVLTGFPASWSAPIGLDKKVRRAVAAVVSFFFASFFFLCESCGYVDRSRHRRPQDIRRRPELVPQTYASPFYHFRFTLDFPASNFSF